MYHEMIIIFFKILHRSAVAWLFLLGCVMKTKLAFNHCFCYIDCTKPTFSKFIQIKFTFLLQLP